MQRGVKLKVLHTSDWHLGKIIHGKSMLDDQLYFIENNFFPVINEYNPDVVLISGDIYDRPIAPLEAINLFNRVTKILYQKKIKVLCIAGNHDSPERISTYSDILSNSGVYFRSNIKDCFNPIRIEKGGVNVNFYLMPHFDLTKAKLIFKDYNDPDDIISSLDDAYEKFVEKIYDNLNVDEINVLAAHCFISGSRISDSESPLSVGNSCEVGSGKFSKFDYVALGHLHSPQQSASNMRYSGSPLKYSFGEPDRLKSMTMINFKNKNNILVEQIPITPLHEMQTIEGNFNDIMDLGRLNINNNYVRILLKDREPIFMPVYRLREFYPNILELSSECLKPQAKQKNCSCNALSDKMEVFKSFMRDICGVEVTQNDCKFFSKALNQALKEDF